MSAGETYRAASFPLAQSQRSAHQGDEGGLLWRPGAGQAANEASCFRSRRFECLRRGGSLCSAEEGDNRYHAILGGGPCHHVQPSSLGTALSALDGEDYRTAMREVQHGIGRIEEFVASWDSGEVMDEEFPELTFR